MSIEGMVALVIAITQVLKKVVPINANIVAVIVAALVVAYEAIAAGTPFTIALIPILVKVVLGAIGAFKVGQQILAGK